MQKTKLSWIMVAILGGLMAFSPVTRAADATTDTKADVKTEIKADTKADAKTEVKTDAAVQPKRVDQLQHLTKALSLTDDQKAKVKTLLAEQNAKIKELREEKADRKEVAKLRAETNVKIRALLNAEQQAKFDKMNTKPTGNADAKPEGKPHKKAEKAEKAAQ
jgi:Spy/CpxP family protein refolding chaperone